MGKKNSFIAAAFAASCLCGAGIFISTDQVWCREPGVPCKETDLLRFSVLIGGIMSALISGRAVDLCGRRSSLIFAAVCWLIAAVFHLTLPFPVIKPQSTLVGVSSQHLKSHQSAPFGITSKYLVNSSHVSKSSLLNFHLPPSSIVSSNVPNLLQQDHGSSYATSPLWTKDNSSLCKHLDEQFSPQVPCIICNLFIGVASAASIVSASVYVLEISRMSVRARFISISDFFSAISGLFLPVMNAHILFIAITACLPVIILSLFLLLPLNIPNYLLLPRSPYHLILGSIIQKRKSYNNRSFDNVYDEKAGKSCIYNPLSYVSSSFQKITFSFTQILKIPFHSTTNKIYEVNSRKNSSGDSDDGSFCMNDPTKQSELEIELDKLQAAENRGLSANYSRVHLEEDDGVPFLGETVVSSKRRHLEDENGRENVECSYLDGGRKVMEANEMLSYLYGRRKGEEEAEAIHREFLKDSSDKLHFTLKNLKPIIHTVFKIGFPLIIIHTCATGYEDVVAVSGAIMSKLRFCGASAQTAVSTLKIISAAISVLLLDKIGNQRALVSAALVLAASLLALGFLSPLVASAADPPNPPPVPTLYPLLPTPLPQVLHQEHVIFTENEWKDLLKQGGRHVAPESPVIWLTAISVASFVISGTLVLAPLTRLVLLSSFPTHNRGCGVGISFALQYSMQLIMFLLPCSFHISSFALMFRSSACFSSIVLLLCFLSIENKPQGCGLQRYSCNRRFFHLLSDGKICNMSVANSTAV